MCAYPNIIFIINFNRKNMIIREFGIACIELTPCFPVLKNKSRRLRTNDDFTPCNSETLNVFAGRSELKLLKFNQGPPKSVSFTRPAAGETMGNRFRQFQWQLQNYLAILNY